VVIGVWAVIVAIEEVVESLEVRLRRILRRVVRVEMV